MFLLTFAALFLLSAALVLAFAAGLLAAALLVHATLAVISGAGGVGAVALMLAMMLAANFGSVNCGLLRSIVVVAGSHTESESGSDKSG